MKKNLVTAAATAGLIFTAFGASASAQENTYTVHPGDSLWKISKVNNVSIHNLKDWNDLSSDRIYVNQKLSLTYTVKSGDSLWTIARSYGTTVRELQSTNGFTTNLIHPGQQLKIPTANVISSSSSVPTTKTDASSYVIQKGDTLSTIGTRYNLSVSKLKSMNQLTSNKIIAGKILKLRSERANASAINGSAASNSEVKAPAAPAESQIAPAASQQSENQMAPAASKSTENQTAPVASQPTENKTAPVASQPTENKTAPVASQPTENQTAPVASQPEGNQAASPASQPAVQPEAPTASPAAEKPAAIAASNVQAIIAEAKKYMGTPYRWGGNTPSGFDCSGFVKYVFDKFGVSLPRTTSEQWGATTPVNSPSIGDLVFFETYQPGPSHVGIYLGNNQFISATDSGVKISNMASSYWGPRYLGARKTL
ncbi:LysM peptidoglycan-binding domain-containing protein [Bacillus sp. EB600]|nr:LysM peptidoglycan-binding domain-containing protein [Bacillus sp. EB600]MCQ6279270.1 LysM peptidoglycan-binding domain-containing protein [Bacillus sp. EB600]